MDVTHLVVPPEKAIASIFLLPDCNMACTFCASEFGFDTLSMANATALLERLRSQGIRRVVLGGGEPFLWPHGLLDLCKAAKALNFEVQVCTNGTLIPKGFEHEPAIDRFILPLEALRPQVHDQLRVLPGGHHHPRVMATVDRLLTAGHSLTFSTVVTRENHGDLASLADWLEGLAARGARIHAWHLYRFLPVGRGGRRHARDLEIPLTAYLKAVEALRTRDRGFRIYRRDNMQKATTVAYYWSQDGALQSA